MLHFVTGNMFESDANVMVCPVNTRGVMGAGLARRFRELYPKMSAAYSRLCLSGYIKVGMVWPWQENGVTVLCIAIKEDWRNPSKVEYIESGLAALRDWLQQRIEDGVTDGKRDYVALPALGCGLGGLSFKDDFKPLVDKILGEMGGVTIAVYGPKKE